MIIPHAPFNLSTFTKLLDTSLLSRGFGHSALLFTQFGHLIDVEHCNCIIRRYTDSGKHLYSVFVFAQMHRLDIRPNHSTFPSVLKSAAQICYGRFGESVHCSVTKMGFCSDMYANTSLVRMYCVCGQPSLARMLFDEMPQRNVVSWNSLISGYLHCGKFREAIHVFREMQGSEIEPGEMTMASVLSACAHLGALDQGKSVHDYIINKGLMMNVYVGTALIDMYAKCGDIDEGERVFEAMRAKNVQTWNVLISGYAMNGRGEAALLTFNRMIMENFKPDVVTFLGVLCACCHQGFVEEGRKLFARMRNEFGLQPKIEHYGCMVDLLGRGGFLDDAMEMIRSMNLKPDPVIWRALLVACRFHGRAELGEFAFQKLVELEPRNADNYVSLSNVYVHDKKWAEVGELRKLMDRRGIRKVPGCSSIEIENVMYVFKASDSIGPGHVDVHNMLAEMKEKLKFAGYAAETGMVLYDVEEEEKEHNLIYHSEKLALAFGLLNSSSTALRIMKNLRICQDCHHFFKLVSAVYRRNIIVRDRYRFHHFTGGICSCKDYW
nr:pentatricopeptide repeat-containing protein At2g02980, chloroplastic-like [Ipomoea batatas]